MKKIHTLVVFLGPPAFLTLYGLGLPGSWNLPPENGWLWAPNVYTLFCWIVAFGVVPVLTVLRLLAGRPRPSSRAGARSSMWPRRWAIRRSARVNIGPWRCGLAIRFFRSNSAKRMCALPRLPAAWHGLKILHLTDLHMCGTPDKAFYRYVMDRCNDWRPDLVAVTGDIVDSTKHHRWILPVLGRLRWRIAGYATPATTIPGCGRNTRAAACCLGFRVLKNCWEEIDVDGKPMAVVGHEGPWFQPEPNLRNCPADMFRLAFSHTPDNMPWARNNGVDLVLAGHNHGGQIRFPLVGSVLVPSRYNRRYDCGVFEEGPTVLHVSRGLAGQHPLRYNCRPEVTLITMHAAEAAGSVREQSEAEVLAAGAS